jgi:FlgN protein
MTDDLSELTAVLAEEVALGRELLDNLSAQREAILCWKISDLIDRVENRELLFSNLTILERRRKRLVEQLTGDEAATVTLSGIIADRPAGAADELARLQKAARRLYSRLHSEERNLFDLMQNLLQHIREALTPLAEPEVALYGGAAAPRLSSGLIQGKV